MQRICQKIKETDNPIPTYKTNPFRISDMVRAEIIVANEDQVVEAYKIVK